MTPDNDNFPAPVTFEMAVERAACTMYERLHYVPWSQASEAAQANFRAIARTIVSERSNPSPEPQECR